MSERFLRKEGLKKEKKEGKNAFENFDLIALNMITETVDTFTERLKKCTETTRNNGWECIADTITVLMANISIITELKSANISEGDKKIFEEHLSKIKIFNKEREGMIQGGDRNELNDFISRFNHEIGLLKEDAKKILGLKNF